MADSENGRPDAAWMQAVLDRVEAMIAEHGFMVQAVAGDDTEPPYAYTVGLARQDRAELTVAGLPHEMAYALLGTAAERPPGDLLPGSEVAGVANVVLRAVAVEPELLGEGVSFAIAERVLGPQLWRHGVIQLVWPDAAGRFPGEPGYVGRQPVWGRLPNL